MTEIPRRRSLWLSGAAAVLPFAALTIAASGVAAAPDGFAPPQSRLHLTRVLHSPLADGKEVVARRTYEVSIVADGEGFRVDGRLVDCSVEAPPPLEMLAEVERNRPDPGLFPLRLDAQGMIVPGPAPAAGEAMTRAATLAAAVIAGSGRGGAEQREGQAFIARLQAQPAQTRWPRDLFRPAPGRRVDRQEFALPDGSAGSVTIETEGRDDGPGGLLAAMQRVVVSELGGSRRVTREEWTLAVAG